MRNRLLITTLLVGLGAVYGITDEKGNPVPAPDQITQGAFNAMDERAKDAKNDAVDVLWTGLSYCSGAYAGIGLAVAIPAAILGAALIITGAWVSIIEGITSAFGKIAAIFGASIGSSTVTAPGAVLTVAEGIGGGSTFGTTVASGSSGLLSALSGEAGGSAVFATAAESAGTTAGAGVTAVTNVTNVIAIPGSVAGTVVTVGEVSATNILAAAMAQACGWTSAEAIKTFIFLANVLDATIVGIPMTVPMYFVPQQADPLTKCMAYVRDRAGFVFFQRLGTTEVIAQSYITIYNTTPYYLILSFSWTGAPISTARIRYAIPPMVNPDDPTDRCPKRILYPLPGYWLNWVKLEVLQDERAVDLGIVQPTTIRPIYGKLPLLGHCPAANEILAATVSMANLSGGVQSLQLSKCHGLEPAAHGDVFGSPMWMDQTQV